MRVRGCIARTAHRTISGMDTLTRLPLAEHAARALEEHRAEADAEWAKTSAATAEHHHAAASRELARITTLTLPPSAVIVDRDSFAAHATIDGVAFVSPNIPHADGIVRWHLAHTCPCGTSTWTEAYVLNLATLGAMLEEDHPRLAPHERPDGHLCQPDDRALPGDPEPRHTFAFAVGTRELREQYDRIVSRCRHIEFKQMGTGVVLIGELWPVPTAEGENF